MNKKTSRSKRVTATKKSTPTTIKAIRSTKKTVRSKRATPAPKSTKPTKKAIRSTKKAVRSTKKAVRSKTKKPSNKGTSLSKGYVIGPFRYKVNPKGGIKPLIELDRYNTKVKYERGKGAIYKGTGTKEDPIIIEQPGPNGDNIFIDLTNDSNTSRKTSTKPKSTSSRELKRLNVDSNKIDQIINEGRVLRERTPINYVE